MEVDQERLIEYSLASVVRIAACIVETQHELRRPVRP